MSPKLRQRTALLLIAFMAMLPLHAIQAAMGSLSMQHGNATAQHGHGDHARHHMQQMGSMQNCPMHHPASGHGASSGHCSGCDLCGACTAALLPSLQLQPTSNNEHLIPALETRHPAPPAYSLFRPPRA
jgi:hypothetical protein